MADNLTLALKIKTDLGNALKDFKTLENELQRTGSAGEKLGAQSSTGADGLDKLGTGAERVTSKLGKTRAGVESISKQLASFRNQVYLFQSLAPISLGITNLANTADAYNNYQSRIRLISQSNQEAQGTFHQLMDVANQTGQLFSATAELYTRVYRSMGETANSAEVLQFTKTIQQALVVSGASAQESESALIQLSQGLAAGALRGEEFNSVAEQAPVILEVLQKSLGKTRGELRKMAEEGKLGTQLILGAVKGASEEIEAQYSQMPQTISRSINELSNNWMSFVGQADNSFSASSGIASAISFLGQNLNALASIMVIVAGVMTARVASGFVNASVAAVRYNLATLQANSTTVARATIEVKAAQSALALAKATDGETLAVQRLAAANRNLAQAKAATALSRTGGIAGAFLGGPLGIGITAVMGLVAAYQFLKSKEQELEVQYNQTMSSLQAHIDKTEELIEARKRLGEIGGFEDRLTQVDSNQKSIDEAQQELDLLKEKLKIQELTKQTVEETGGFTFGIDDRIEEYTNKITTLEEELNSLKNSTQELGDITQEQLQSAFDAAIEKGGELANVLKEIGDSSSPEAIEKLTPVIKEAETQMQSANDEMTRLNEKLGKEFSSITQTAEEQLRNLGTRFLDMAKDAGLSGKAIDDFNAKLQENLNLINDVEAAKQAQENKKYLESLKERQATQNMTAGQRIKYQNRQKGLTGEELQEADKLADLIDKNSRRSTRGSAKKQAYDSEGKNLELNIQYLRLTGQEVKANLTDIEGRYNKLLTEFQKHGNVDGINLIKKILPLEQAKTQIEGVQSEVNQLFQNQSLQEQRIQSQVQTGLISHLEGQRQLKEIYAQTTAEIEKQLPLLEKLAQMPGAQGEQARIMLDRMKIKISELKTAGNDLEKAFKDGLTQGIQSSLMGLAQGTMSLKDAIKNLALTVINAMAQVAAQQLAMQAMSAVSSGWGNAAGSAVGAVFASTGGYISGPGTGTSDSILARLSNGEYVIRAASVSKYGVGFLNALNRGHIKHFSRGGLVSAPTINKPSEPGLTQGLKNGLNQEKEASPVNIKQTLVVDSQELFTSGINTVEGERAVLTVIRANKETLKQELN